MDTAALQALLGCEDIGGVVRVKSREKGALEFKQNFDENCLRKSLKTIAAFANCGGGKVIFGVTDKPRTVCGVTTDIDEAHIQDILLKHLHPIPRVELYEVDIFEKRVFVLDVFADSKPPVLAIAECQSVGGNKNSTVLSPGVIYFRRAGQTRPATGMEFSSLLEKRDNAIRASILGLISRASDIGFDNVAVADFRDSGPTKEGVTLWVPENAAKSLNIIEHGKLVQSNGAPAYEIRGTIQAVVSRNKDPRKPLLPERSVRALRHTIHSTFWPTIPWAARHLNAAAKHLGFWDERLGDNVHTLRDEATGRVFYFEAGRAAIEKFASRSPNEFIDVVGSKETKSEWRRKQKEIAAIAIPGL